MNRDQLKFILNGAILAVSIMLTAYLADLISLKDLFSLVGLALDYFAALILINAVLSPHMTGLRLSKAVRKQSKEWFRRFPLFVADRLGSTDPSHTIETSLGTYSEAFWGLLLMAVGFLMQILSQAF